MTSPSTSTESSSFTPGLNKRSDSKNSLTITTTLLDLSTIPTIHVSSPTSPIHNLSSLPGEGKGEGGESNNNNNNMKDRNFNSTPMTILTEEGSSGGSSGNNSSAEEEVGSSSRKSKFSKEEKKLGKKKEKGSTNSSNSNSTISTTTTRKESPSSLPSPSPSPTSPSTSLFSFLPSLNLNLDSLPSLSLPSPTNLNFSLPSFNLNLSSLLPKLNANNISFLPGSEEDEFPPRSGTRRRRKGRARVGEIIGAGVGEEEKGAYEVISRTTAMTSIGEGELDGRDSRTKRSNRYSMDLRMEQATANGETFEDVSHDSDDSSTIPLPISTTSPSSTSTPSLPFFSPLIKPPTFSSSSSSQSIPILSSAAFTKATKSTPVNPLTLQSIVRKNSETDALKLIRDREERERKWRSEALVAAGGGGGGGGGEGVRPSLMTRLSSKGLRNDLVRVESPTDIGEGEEEDAKYPTRQKRNVSEATIVPSTSNNRSLSGMTEEVVESLTGVASSSTAKPSLESTTSGSINSSKNTTTSSTPLAGTSQIKRKMSPLSRFGRGRVSSNAGTEAVILEEPKEKEVVIPKNEKVGSGGSRIDKGKEKEKVKYVKTKSKNKVTKDFGKLFLAQELYISPPSSTSSTSSPSTSKLSSPQREDSESLHSTHSTRDDNASQHSIHTEDTSHHTSTAAPGKTKNAIWSIKFSLDGKYLASGGKDGIVRVWEVLSTPEARQQALHPEPPSSPTSPSSSIPRTPFASMPVFKSKPLHEFAGHTADVLDLSWSKNNFLLSSSMDKTVRLWHVSRSDCLCAFQHLDFVTSICFHPCDDRFFISGSLDCKLRLWNIPEKRVHVWTELPDLITSVAFTSDGKLAAAGNFVGTVMLFEVETFRIHSQFVSKSSRGKNSKGKKITSMVPFPKGLKGSEGEMFLVTSNDSRIRVFQISDKSLAAKYAGHENASSQIRGSFSDDGRFIISGSEDRNVYIWDSGLLNKDVGNWTLRKKNQEAGYESFHLSANVITCACFAPTTTGSILASSFDPIFSAYSTTASLTTSIPASRTTTQDSSPFPSVSGSEDCIIVTADDVTGVISVFRNSTFVNGEEVVKSYKRQSRAYSESSARSR